MAGDKLVLIAPRLVLWQCHGSDVFGERPGLDLLRQLVPKATLVAVLVNPGSVETEAERRDVQAAAQRLGQQLIILDASSDRDIETSFATAAKRGAGALLSLESRF